MFSAGVGAAFVDRAAAGVPVEELAVAIGATGEGEEAVLVVVALDLFGLDQTTGDQTGFFVLGFEGVDQTETDQIGQTNLDRHGAAVGGTGVAQAGAEAGPGLQAVDIDEVNRGAHGEAGRSKKGWDRQWTGHAD